MAKLIFNSLGSNYDFTLAKKALELLFRSDPSWPRKLETKLLSLWPGREIYLTLKGRDAIELAIRGLGIKFGEVVLTQAFSCVAVEEAIIRAGAKPSYYDLAKNRLTPDIQTLEKSYQQLLKENINASQIKAVIVQHSLGTPGPTLAIKQWCQEHQLFLIEDLAQAAGGEDEKGNLLGQGANAIIFSFGRDKIFDAVAGGAVIFKSAPKVALAQLIETEFSPLWVIRDLTYPFFAWLVRQTFSVGIGKVLLKVFQSFGWWRSPVLADCYRPTQLSAAYAGLVLERLKKNPAEAAHRRQIASIYQTQLKKYSLLSDAELAKGSNQRYPILLDKPQEFIDYMKENGVYLADRWYRAPVDSGSLARPTVYQTGSCPNAEAVAKKIVNLPTHINVEIKDAQRICRLIISFSSIGSK